MSNFRNFVVEITTIEEYSKAYGELLANASHSEKKELLRLRIDSVKRSEQNDKTVLMTVCAVVKENNKVLGFEAISMTRAHKGWERSMFISKDARGYNLAAIMMELCAKYIADIDPDLKFIYSHGGTPTTDAIYLNVFKLKPIKWKITEKDGAQRAGVFKRSSGFDKRLAEFTQKGFDKGIGELLVVINPELIKKTEDLGFNVAKIMEQALKTEEII